MSATEDRKRFKELTQSLIEADQLLRRYGMELFIGYGPYQDHEVDLAHVDYFIENAYAIQQNLNRQAENARIEEEERLQWYYKTRCTFRKKNKANHTLTCKRTVSALDDQKHGGYSLPDGFPELGDEFKYCKKHLKIIRGSESLPDCTVDDPTV